MVLITLKLKKNKHQIFRTSLFENRAHGFCTRTVRQRSPELCFEVVWYQSFKFWYHDSLAWFWCLFISLFLVLRAFLFNSCQFDAASSTLQQRCYFCFWGCCRLPSTSFDTHSETIILTSNNYSVQIASAAAPTKNLPCVFTGRVLYVPEWMFCSCPACTPSTAAWLLGIWSFLVVSTLSSLIRRRLEMISLRRTSLTRHSKTLTSRCWTEGTDETTLGEKSISFTLKTNTAFVIQDQTTAVFEQRVVVAPSWTLTWLVWVRDWVYVFTLLSRESHLETSPSAPCGQDPANK